MMYTLTLNLIWYIPYCFISILFFNKMIHFHHFLFIFEKKKSQEYDVTATLKTNTNR